MFRIGIIGCGKIAQTRHIPEYRENPNVELAGYFDFNKERAVELAQKFGGIVYESVEELIADPDIDGVSVCVANDAHAEVSIAALQAGKHVLCEKPMAITLEQCKNMVQAAKEAGKFLMIGQNQRLTKAHIRAKKLLEQGAIGDVITFRTTFGHGGPETWSIDQGNNSWFFDKKRAAMGSMADLGVHKTDLIQYLLNQKVVETMARLVTLDKKDSLGNPIGVDDNAICIYTMESGIIGTMTASWTYYGQEDNSTVIYGTKGIMHIYDDDRYSIKIVTKEGEEINYILDQIQTNDHQTNTGIIDAFVDSLVNNHEPLISGTDVLTAMRAIFASIESGKTGQAARVEQD